jgi:hypothetical protein
MAQSPTPPVWAFSARLIMEAVNASNLPTDKNYKPTSYLYAKNERKGVFAKGSELKGNVVVKKIVFDGDNWEVEALVPSESSPNTAYTVTIYLPLDFECTCPHGQHRFNPCKHVFAAVLKLLEIAGADARDPIIRHYIYEGLNKLAYHKAKTQRYLV